MFARKSSSLVPMLLFVFTLAVCAEKHGRSVNTENLDGTWVDMKEYLISPGIKDREYSWGMGKRLVETTLEIEMQKNKILLPGTGLFFIQRISNESSSSVSVDIKGPGEEGGWEMRLIFHFLDRDTFWIECADLEGMFSVGRNKPWYRLSGPPR